MKFINKEKFTVIMFQTEDDELYMLRDGVWYAEPGADLTEQPVTDQELIQQLVEAYNNYQ